MTATKALSYLLLLELGTIISATQTFSSNGSKYKMILN